MVLFMDGLREYLKGWIKALNPPTLQDAIKKSRDMEASTSRRKFQSKGVPNKRDKDKQQFQRDTQQPQNYSNRLDIENLNELKRNKLCFHFREPWDPSHKFILKPKAK